MLAVISGIATARWTLALADHLDVVSAGAMLVLGGLLITATGRRRGRVWTVLHAGGVLTAFVLLGAAAVLAACVATGCFN
ncbi:MAG: hypothetical protein WKF42_01485 [Solirubrobacteraceae bacterium]